MVPIKIWKLLIKCLESFHLLSLWQNPNMGCIYVTNTFMWVITTTLIKVQWQNHQTNSFYIVLHTTISFICLFIYEVYPIQMVCSCPSKNNYLSLDTFMLQNCFYLFTDMHLRNETQALFNREKATVHTAPVHYYTVLL